jgi:hypothetical protein
VHDTQRANFGVAWIEPILLYRSIESAVSLCQRIYIGDCIILQRRKFKLVFFLDTSFKLVFWLDTTLKLVNSQMLLNAAFVHDRVICEPPNCYKKFKETRAALKFGELRSGNA